MKALFIGRFQPFHKAHLYDIKLAIREGYEILIGVGSSQESHTKENPFTYVERKKMIELALDREKIDGYKIIAIPDINDDSKWVDHVKEIVREFDVVYTGNDLTERLFEEKGIRVRKIKLIPLINATEIRKRILHGKDWKELVPGMVAEQVEKMGGIGRIKEIKYS